MNTGTISIKCAQQKKIVKTSLMINIIKYLVKKVINNNTNQIIFLKRISIINNSSLVRSYTVT